MKNKTLWAIHSWMGLYWGVIIAFLSITGAAALFRTEVDLALRPDLRTTAVQAQKSALDDAIARISSQHPDKYIFEVELPQSVDGTWNVRLFPHKKSKLFPLLLEVFIDPFTGEVLGSRNYYETAHYYLRNLHVRFYEGQFGRQIVGLAGIALLISTITGFLIYGNFMKKRPFGNIRRKNLRMSQADYHKLIGVSALAFNLLISLTGAWLGLQPYLQKWEPLSRPNNFSRTAKVLDSPSDKAFPFSYDSVYQATRQHFPELIPHHIRPSTNGERAVEVFGDVPKQVYERFSNKIVFDKANYRPLFKYNISEASISGKVFFAQEALHFGDFGGIGLKLLYCLLGLTSGFLSLSGFIVYLERTAKKRREKPSFVELKPLLLRWGGGIISFCLLIGIMSVVWGIGIPTLLVSITFYALLAGWLLWTVFQTVKERLNKKKHGWSYEKSV